MRYGKHITHHCSLLHTRRLPLGGDGRDVSGAMAWYGKAASKGHPSAMHNLASTLYQHHTRHDNNRLSLIQSQRQSGGNSTEALGQQRGQEHEQGETHGKGEGEGGEGDGWGDRAQDLTRARALWESAAALGHAGAHTGLGVMVRRNMYRVRSSGSS